MCVLEIMVCGRVLQLVWISLFLFTQQLRCGVVQKLHEEKVSIKYETSTQGKCTENNTRQFGIFGPGAGFDCRSNENICRDGTACDHGSGACRRIIDV